MKIDEARRELQSKLKRRVLWAMVYMYILRYGGIRRKYCVWCIIVLQYSLNPVDDLLTISNHRIVVGGLGQKFVTGASCVLGEA